MFARSAKRSWIGATVEPQLFTGSPLDPKCKKQNSEEVVEFE